MMALREKPAAKKAKKAKTFDDLLVDLKTSNSEKIRYNAARVLGEMGDLNAVEPLIEVLKEDKNGSVRLYAARALGELGDDRATQPLIDSLREDRNVDVRVRAARAGAHPRPAAVRVPVSTRTRE